MHPGKEAKEMMMKNGFWEMFPSEFFEGLHVPNKYWSRILVYQALVPCLSFGFEGHLGVISPRSVFLVSCYVLLAALGIYLSRKGKMWIAVLYAFILVAPAIIIGFWGRSFLPI